jgi:hypothetical protein
MRHLVRLGAEARRRMHKSQNNSDHTAKIAAGSGNAAIWTANKDGLTTNGENMLHAKSQPKNEHPLRAWPQLGQAAINPGGLACACHVMAKGDAQCYPAPVAQFLHGDIAQQESDWAVEKFLWLPHVIFDLVSHHVWLSVFQGPRSVVLPSPTHRGRDRICTFELKPWSLLQWSHSRRSMSMFGRAC